MTLVHSSESRPPLVLVHGMLDSSSVFNRLLSHLREPRRPLLLAELPLRCGMTPIAESAALLDQQIQAAFGAEQPVDLLLVLLCEGLAMVAHDLLGQNLERLRHALPRLVQQHDLLIRLPLGLAVIFLQRGVRCLQIAQRKAAGRYNEEVKFCMSKDDEAAANMKRTRPLFPLPIEP